MYSQFIITKPTPTYHGSESFAARKEAPWSHSPSRHLPLPLLVPVGLMGDMLSARLVRQGPEELGLCRLTFGRLHISFSSASFYNDLSDSLLMLKLFASVLLGSLGECPHFLSPSIKLTFQDLSNCCFPGRLHDFHFSALPLYMTKNTLQYVQLPIYFSISLSRPGIKALWFSFVLFL